MQHGLQREFQGRLLHQSELADEGQEGCDAAHSRSAGRQRTAGKGVEQQSAQRPEQEHRRRTAAADTQHRGCDRPWHRRCELRQPEGGVLHAGSSALDSDRDKVLRRQPTCHRRAALFRVRQRMDEREDRNTMGLRGPWHVVRVRQSEAALDKQGSQRTHRDIRRCPRLENRGTTADRQQPDRRGEMFWRQGPLRACADAQGHHDCSLCAQRD